MQLLLTCLSLLSERFLQTEYEKLHIEKGSSLMSSNGTSDSIYGYALQGMAAGLDNDLNGSIGTQVKEEVLLAEARALRQHKGRLEARMKILEDHNHQLESQLGRLRQMLESEANEAPRNGSASVTRTPSRNLPAVNGNGVASRSVNGNSTNGHATNGHSANGHSANGHSNGSSEPREGGTDSTHNDDAVESMRSS